MKQKNKPSAAETAILSILWDHQPCSVKFVHGLLSNTKSVGYTTTLKQFQRMLEKGLVERKPGKGKSFLYTATETELETKDHLFERFVETAFGNSVSDLVMHALGKAEPSDAELATIKDLIEKLDRE